jgi:hypothetical protein
MSASMSGSAIVFKDGGGSTLVRLVVNGDDDVSLEGATGERVRLSKADVDHNHVSKSANYTTVVGDSIVGVDTTGGAVTITLHAANTTGVTGRVYTIMDEGGNAGTNNITVTADGTDTINGSTDDAYVNGDYNRLQLYSDGTRWFAM